MAPTIYAKLERAPEFLAGLRKYKRKDLKGIWSYCARELNHLQNDWWLPPGASEPQRGYKKTTIRSTLTLYRNEIRREFGPKHPALKSLRPSNKLQIEVRDKYDQELAKRHKELRPIDCDALVQTAIAILQSPILESKDRQRMIAALELLTGRRGWEVACAGRFAKRRGGRPPALFAKAKKWTLIFDGQAKTRGAKTAQTGPYEIPVLAPPDLILSAIDRLHRAFPLRQTIKTDKQFNRDVGKATSAMAREIFFDERRPYRSGLNSHLLRAAYATITFTWFCPDSVSMNAWHARTLGHSEHDIKTALSYIRFYPVGQRSAFIQDFGAGAREELSELARQRERAAEEHREQLREHLTQRMDVFRKGLPVHQRPRQRKATSPARSRARRRRTKRRAA